MDMMKLLGRLISAALDADTPRQRTAPQKRRSAAKPKRSPSRSQSSRSVTSAQPVYTDQPIPQRMQSAFSAVPQQIRQMRTISGYSTQGGMRTMESLFFQQAEFMEYYTDDFPENVPCSRTVPTYANMKNDELRAYFAWRTRWRAGQKPPAQTAFLLLVSYELLQLIGANGTEDAYTKLEQLLADYGEAFPGFQRQLLSWLPDFAAYYRIPYRCSDPREAARITIVRHSGHTDTELLEALSSFSKYHLTKSKRYLAAPEETAAVLHAVYAALLAYYAEQKNASFPAYLLGSHRRAAHMMFDGAVFWFRRMPPDGSVRLSPLRTYHCSGGQWAVESFCTAPDSARIGDFLRTFDSILREESGYRTKLKAAPLPDGDADVIRTAIRSWYQEQARRNAPVITLDADELAAIRQAAAHTTDMLTLPEEPEEMQPLPQHPAPAPLPEAADQPDASLPDLPLSTPAAALLLCLLTGQSVQPLIDGGHMLSVLADEINEALYDQFGDSVIETDDAGMPALIEDYTDDLKGLFAI